MYANSKLAITELINNAEEFIMLNDRLLYKPFFEKIESFCVANNVIFGGRIGVNNLLNRSLTREDFLWELYSPNIHAVSKRLIMELYNTRSPHIPVETLALETVIKHKELVINIMGRSIARLYGIAYHKGKDLLEIISPVYTKAHYIDQQVQCFPPEIQLIETYHILYNPAKVSMWKYEFANESDLFKLLKLEDCPKKGSIKPNNIMQKLIDHCDAIIIGDYAVNKLLGLMKPNPRLQVITSSDPSTVIDLIKPLIDAPTLKYVKHDVHIPVDFQLIKYSIYSEENGTNNHILDMFNSTSFELVPYLDGNIANPWVILRFLFIELWVLKMIMSTKNQSDKCEIFRKYTTNTAKELRLYIEKNPSSVFSLNDYKGVYIKESVSKKKLVMIQGMLPVYYPAMDSSDQRTGGADQYLGGIDDYVTDQLVSKPIDLTHRKKVKLEILKHYIHTDKPLSEAIELYQKKCEVQCYPVVPSDLIKTHGDLVQFIPENIEGVLIVGNCIFRSHATIKKVDYLTDQIGKYDLIIIHQACFRLVNFDTLKKGQRVIVTDYDVKDKKIATDVDFRLFLEYCCDGKLMIDNFDQYIKCKYRSREDLHGVFLSLGFKRVYTEYMDDKLGLYVSVYCKQCSM
jgi:hypothetical protein